MCGTKKATKCGVAWIGAAGMAEHFRQLSKAFRDDI
jgi:hypothetical protein